MKPNNIFRNAQGEPINQFVGDASGFDIAVEQVKQHGIRITKSTPQYEIPMIIEQLRHGKDGTLVFIND